MKVPVLSLALAVLLSAAGAGTPAPAPQLGGRQARPLPGSATVIAMGAAPVVAWLDATAAGTHVRAMVGDGPALRLGPTTRGSDGQPTAAATDDGSVWIAASRSDAAGVHLWTQRWANGVWEEADDGPRGGSLDRHPALAAAPGSSDLWVTWIGEQADDPAGPSLFASHWRGGAWSPAEALPRVTGAPMAPSIALDRGGEPIVVWAASDGSDAEIWLTQRQGGAWSPPTPLSANAVPDIVPSVAAAAGTVVTWISYTDNGYLPLVRWRTAGRWSAPQRLSEAPAAWPLAAVVDGTPVVLWRRLDDAASGGTMIARRLQGGSWQAPVELVPAAGSPFGFDSGADGRIELVWTRPNGELGHLAARGTSTQGNWEALRAAAAAGGSSEAAFAPRSPSDASAALVKLAARYTAFGDSITAGLIFDPDPHFSEGYRGPLQSLLQESLGIGTVLDAGVDGEMTADGVARIKSVVASQGPDAVLVMEGTNDLFAGVDHSVIAFNLRQIIDRARQERPELFPFLALVPPRSDPDFGFAGPYNDAVDELNALLPSIAEELNVPLVDENTPLRDHPEYYSQATHPSALGYQVIAQAWFDVVRPFVAEHSSRGDIDGSGRTDGLDLVRLALAFGAIEGEPRYDPDSDITGDGIIDGFDLDILVEFFGQPSMSS